MSLVVVLLLGGCAGSTPTSTACAGIPTAKHTRELLVLFGAVRKLNRKFLCSQLGSPNSINSGSDGAEVWTYGNETFTLKNGKVIAAHAPKSAIGG